jgi:DNA-binding NarL/FixJ family response regulator
VRESGVDIVIVDISTPEGGIEVVKSIFRHLSHCKLPVLTALDDAICVSQVIAAGARG